MYIDSIEDSLCSFEVSKLLKEHKFNIEVHKEWVHNTTEPLDDEFWIRTWDSTHNFNNHKGEHYSCPTNFVASEWVRLKYNLWIQIEFGKDEDKVWFNWCIYSLEKNYNYEPIAESECGLDSPVEAMDEALEYVLTNLI